MKSSATSLLILLLKVPYSFSNVLNALRKDGNFQALIGALDRADLMTELVGDGPFTIFAPTDDAFEELNNDLFICLLEKKGLLRDILKYHIVKEKITNFYDIDYDASLETLHGDYVTRSDLSEIRNYGKEKIVVGNNVIQIADSLLVPPTVVSNTDFSKTCKSYDICNSMMDDLNVTDWNEWLYYDFAYGITCSCQTVDQQDPKALKLHEQIEARVTCEDAKELCYDQACFVRSSESFIFKYEDSFGNYYYRRRYKNCYNFNTQSFDGEKFCSIYDGDDFIISINGEACNNYTSDYEIIYETDETEISIDYVYTDCSNLGYDKFSLYEDCTWNKNNDDYQCEELNRTTNEGLISWYFHFNEDVKFTPASSGSQKFFAVTNFITGIIIGMVVMS